MSTSAVLSDSSPRHRYGRRSALKKSAQSDFDEPEDTHSQDQEGQRSSSVCPAPGIPRMAQLETLEAKMASIEVSLSMTPRRRKSSLLGRCAPLPPHPPAPPAHSPHPDPVDPLRAHLKDKEHMIQSLKEQLCSRPPTGSGGGGGGGAMQPPLTEAERRGAETRIGRLRGDMEAKRAAIKGLKGALEKLDITDNIDVRIQQAELEYQLGREELELLTLLEQSRALQLLLEQDDNAKTKQDQQTIYSCIDGSMVVTLHCVQVEYDPKSPQFGAGARARGGLWVDWALDHTGMCKGDSDITNDGHVEELKSGNQKIRLLEVNGKLVLSKSKEDVGRLLSISPSPAQLVVLRSRPLDGTDQAGSRIATHSALAQMGSLRSELNALREQAEDARRTKDGLRSDNLRLTHRITYLEEQVAELLDRNRDRDPDAEAQIMTPHNVLTSTVNMQRNVTNINITSEPTAKPNQSKADVQVFQKGPDVTALVANLPGLEVGGKDTAEASANLPIIRPRSNQSNVSSTQIAIGQGHSPKSNGSKSSYSVELNDVVPRSNSHYPSSHVHFNHKSSKLNNRYSLQPSRSSNSIDHHSDVDKGSKADIKPYSLRQSLSNHSVHKSKDYPNYDYNSETSAAIEIIKNNQKHYFDKNYKNSKNHVYSSKALSDDNSDILKCYKREHKKSILEYFDRGINGNRKASKKETKFEDDLNNYHSDKKPDKSSNVSQKSSIFSRKLSKLDNSEPSEKIDFHPERDYIDHRIDGKIIQNAHKSSRRMSKLHVRNIKATECDSEPSLTLEEDKYRKSRMKILDYTSEPNSIQGHYKKHYQHSERPRPAPPKKPLRLSLHRAQSMQSVETGKQSETFYLHDPIQRQTSATDVANRDETKFSISNSNGNINGLFYGNQDDYRIKPESSYANHSGNQLSVKFSLSDNQNISDSANSALDKKVKKRSHNGKISHHNPDKLFMLNGHDGDRNGGYTSSRSESLTSIPKTQNNKVRSINSKENLYNGVNPEALKFNGYKDRSKAELQIKSNRGGVEEYAKKNGYTNYEKHESASESSRTPSRAESCQSPGFRWPSSTVFKNIRIDSPTRTNGHISDGSRK